MGRNSKAVFAAALLGSSALIMPSVSRAQAIPPRFLTVDENNVDVVAGTYVGTFVEGGIGSGKGAVSLVRSAIGPDQWSGLLYRKTIGGVSTMVVTLGPIADTFTLSGSTWVPTKGNGATLVAITNGWRYTAADGTQIVYSTKVTEGGLQLQLYVVDGPGCAGADAGTCAIPISMTQPDGLVFHYDWEYDFHCGGTIFPCPDPRAYFRFNGVTSSANYGFTRTYLTDDPGRFNQPVPNWYVLTGATFVNGTVAQGTVSYTHPSSGVEQFTDVMGRMWTFTSAADGSYHIRRPGSATDNIIVGDNTTNGTVTYVTKDGVTTNYARTVAGTTGTIVTTDPLGHHRTIVSDLTLGRPTSYQNELGFTTSYQYDSDARLTRVTLPESNYTQYTYDARGNVTDLTDHNKGNTDTIATHASYPSTCTNVVTCNSPTTTTDALGHVTDYTYDATHGGVLTVTQPAPTTGAVRPQTRYTYTQVTSAKGDLVYMPTKIAACQTTASCTNGADEAQVVTAYNTNLLPSTVTRRNGTGTLTATDTMAYDTRGNTLTVDGPLSGTADTWAYRYDAADEMVGAISPDPDGTGTLKNRAVRVTYRPDGQVNKQEVGTTLGQTNSAWNAFVPLQTVDIGFDSNSRPITSKLSASGTNYALTQRNYDSLGRPNCTAVRMNTAIYGSLPASACSLGTQGSFGPDRISQAVYDAASEVTQVKVAVATTDAATERTLTYTNNGKVQTLKDAENNLTTFEYDGFDRLLKTQYPNPAKGSGTSSTTDYEQYTYDDNSNLYTLRVRSGDSIAYRYDALDRLVLKDSPVLTATSYTYDNLGRILTGTFNSSGEVVTNGYDALNNLVSTSSTVAGTARSLSYAYDLAGRRTKLTWPDAFHADYDRLVTGELTKVRENGATTGIGVLATYGYDDLGNRSTATYGNGTSQSYGYDPVSRLASLTIDLAGTASDLTETFAYNPASQIVSAIRSNDAYAFTGNATGSISTTTNGLNEMTAVGGVTYANDANGNLSSSGASNYAYDSENHLTTVTAAGPSVGVVRDPLERLSRVVGGAISDRIFLQDPVTGANGDAVVGEYTSDGVLQHRYLPIDGLGAPLVDYNSAGARSWLMTDERGSVIASANDSGAMTAINAYDEYGVPQATNAGRFQYAGQLWLGEVGLTYMRNRMYGSQWGRFLQPDPLGYAGDGPNLYAYVLNDPVNGMDPLGLKGEGVDCKSQPEDPQCIILVTGIRPNRLDLDFLNLVSASTGVLAFGLPSFGHGYSGTNLICRRALSNAEMRDLLSRFAVPGHGGQRLSNGTFLASAGGLAGGEVSTIFQRGGLQVINRTTALHIFSGTVQRDIFTDHGRTYIFTQGSGRATGIFAQARDFLNSSSGPGIFNDLDSEAQQYARSHFKGC